MTASLPEMVRLWREHTGGENPTLLVKTHEGETETAIDAISSAGARVVKRVGYGYLRVENVEGSLEELDSLDAIESIEIEDSGETLERTAEDFPDRPATIL